MAGFIRYKLDNLSVGTHDISMVIGGLTYTKQVIIKPFCSGDLYVKYLDKNGQYRFVSFDKYHDKRDTPQAIGSANKTINYLLNAQSGSKEIGYTNKRLIRATADNISELELSKIIDIYSSPRVYLYIGSGGDSENDWMLVKVRSADNIVKKAKGGFVSVSIEIELPELYTITMQ